MKFQPNEYWCGPAAMAAATRALGKPVGQTSLAKLAGTTEEGTDEEGVKRALIARGFQVDPFGTNIQLVAKRWVYGHLAVGNPIIVAINRWSHWVTLLGTLGDKIVLFDPGRWEYRVQSGVSVYTWSRLCRRWYASKKLRGNDPGYWGIATRLKEKP